MERQRLRKRMNGPQPLEQRVAAALNEKTTITSAALATLFSEVETAIAEVETAAENAKQHVLDPTVDDPFAARLARDDCVFRLERLRAALPPLQQRYTELRAAERRAKWRADYAAVKAKRDATAEKLQAIYELTEQLIEVLQEAKEVDQEVARINSTAPNGEHDRLLATECSARNVTATGPNSVLSLMTEMKLPHWNAPGWAWPPPAPPIDVRQIVPVMPHPGANWAAHQKDAKAQADAEAKRVADYYRRQTREREEMDNAEARAAQARRQSAPT